MQRLSLQINLTIYQRLGLRLVPRRSSERVINRIQPGEGLNLIQFDKMMAPPRYLLQIQKTVAYMQAIKTIGTSRVVLKVRTPGTLMAT